MKKRWLALFLAMALTLAFVLSGCSSGGGDEAPAEEAAEEGGEEAAAEEGKTYRFATISDANNAWNDRLLKGGQEKCAELGNWEIEAFDPQGDVAKQIDLVTQCITQGFDAICLQPIDNSALAPVMEEAADAGIVMITLYELSSDLGLDDKVYQVIYDQTGISKNLILNFAKDYNMPEGVNVAIIGGRTGADNTNQRHQGFDEAIAELGWNKVASKDCEWDQQLAMEAAQDMITAHPEIEVFVAMTDPMAFGTIQAIEAAGLTAANDGSGIYVVGEEFCEESKEYLHDGRLAYSITCPSPWFCQTAIEVANNVVSGKDQEHKTTLDYYWVTADNCDDAEY